MNDKKKLRDFPKVDQKKNREQKVSYREIIGARVVRAVSVGKEANSPLLALRASAGDNYLTYRSMNSPSATLHVPFFFVTSRFFCVYLLFNFSRTTTII